MSTTFPFAAWPAPAPLEANAGVRLLPDIATGELTVQPLRRPAGGGPPTTTSYPFPLTRLPSPMLEQMAGAARALWRRHRRSLSMLLYVDLATTDWEAWVPQQFCGPSSGRFNPDFRNLPAPGDWVRLAGSLRSLPCPAWEDAAAAVPPFEGLHLVVDPGRDWLSLRAFVRAGGDLRPAPLDAVVRDAGDAHLDGLLDRLWLLDRL